MNKLTDILEHNRVSWNKQSIEGSRWCTPVDEKTISDAKKGKWDVILTPVKNVPKLWFGDVSGKDILCLASGGGQQAPLLAAAGAKVVSLDNSEEQLKKDRTVADRHGLPVQTIQGDMADLSAFADASFDLIFHPVSNVFTPDIKKVWNACYRVLRHGGDILSGFMNPTFFLFDHEESEKSNVLQVKYRLPYSDLESIDEKKRQDLVRKQIALEFGHTLDDQVGAQIDAGFVISGFYEDWWSDEATLLNKFSPTFIATRATKSVSTIRNV